MLDVMSKYVKQNVTIAPGLPFKVYVILVYPIYISSTESNVPQVEQDPLLCDQQMNDNGDLFAYCPF